MSGEGLPNLIVTKQDADVRKLERIVTQLDAEHEGACKRANGMTQHGDITEAYMELAAAKALSAMAACIRRTLQLKRQEEHDTQPI